MQNQVFTKVFDTSKEAQEFIDKVKSKVDYVWAKLVIAPLERGHGVTNTKAVAVYVGPSEVE